MNAVNQQSLPAGLLKSTTLLCVGMKSVRIQNTAGFVVLSVSSCGADADDPPAWNRVAFLEQKRLKVD